MKVLQPADWSKPRGFSHGVVVDAPGRWIVLAGQVRQALQNCIDVVAQAGGTPQHIVRLTWYITSKKEYLSSLKEVGAAYRALMGRHFPVMAVVEVSGLMEDEAKLEIEATAVIPGESSS